MSPLTLACALLAAAAQPSLPDLLRQFEAEGVFWRQLDIAVKPPTRAIAA